MSSNKITVTIPLIHLNGNDGKKLLRQYLEAAAELRNAIDAFGSIEFHPRDYYPLEKGAWDRAVAEREEINAAFGTISNYIDQVAAGIYKQTE